MDEVADVTHRRSELLAALVEQPRGKPALVEATGVSRSTVDRAVAELREAGLVERESGTFAATPAARRLLDRYEAYRSAAETRYEHREALDWLHPEDDLPVAFLEGARRRTVDPDDPSKVLWEAHEAVANADAQYVCAYYRLPFYAHVAATAFANGVDYDVVVSEQYLEAMVETGPRTEDMPEDLLTVYGSSELPRYTLGYTEGLSDYDAVDGDRQAGVVLHDDAGQARATLFNDSEAAVEWAKAEWERYCADAEQHFP